MSSVKLNVNTEWLVWARETAHYKKEDIAKKIRKSIETINQWEKTGQIKSFIFPFNSFNTYIVLNFKI